MKCPGCGASIKENSNKCEYCGTNVGEIRKKEEQKEKDKKKNNKALITIIVAIFVLPVIISLIIFIIGGKTISDIAKKQNVETIKEDVNSIEKEFEDIIEKSENEFEMGRKRSDFTYKYRIIRNRINSNIFMSKDASCEENCHSKYDYSTNYDLIVSNKGEYYLITFTLKDESINLNLSSEDCDDVPDATCSGNKIEGKIYKK